VEIVSGRDSRESQRAKTKPGSWPGYINLRGARMIAKLLRVVNTEEGEIRPLLKFVIRLLGALLEGVIEGFLHHRIR
jgi:hypothetical protein